MKHAKVARAQIQEAKKTLNAPLSPIEQAAINEKKQQAIKQGVSVKELMSLEKYQSELGELKEARKDVFSINHKLKSAQAQVTEAVANGMTVKDAESKFEVAELKMELEPAIKATEGSLKEMNSAANELLAAAAGRCSTAGDFESLVEEKRKAYKQLTDAQLAALGAEKAATQVTDALGK